MKGNISAIRFFITVLPLRRDCFKYRTYNKRQKLNLERRRLYCEILGCNHNRAVVPTDLILFVIQLLCCSSNVIGKEVVTTRFENDSSSS